jgi:hypothetical protein
MKWVRSIASAPLGRHTLGSVEVVLDLYSASVRDPTERVIAEHLVAVLPLLASARRNDATYLDHTWAVTRSRLSHAPHPWRIVAGPLAALQAS